MHVQESENLRLRESDGMQHGPRLQPRVFAQLNHHLHAERPLSLRMTVRQPEVRVDLAADGAYRSIRDDGKSGANVHTWHEAFGWRAIRIHSLIDQTHTAQRIVPNQWFADRHPWPQLHDSGTRYLLANPLIELPQREDHAVVFAHEFWNERQLDSMIL